MNTCHSAGPGSGKTRTLVDEFEKALDEADFGSVVAVTFTDKAANEMMERVAKDLRGDERFMEFITSNRIGTIHSFCLSILKNYTSVTDVIDDKLSAVLKDRAVATYLSELTDELLLDNFGFDILQKSLRASLEKRYLRRFSLPDEAVYKSMNDRALYALTAESVGKLKDLLGREDIRSSVSGSFLNYESLSLGDKLSVIEGILGIDCSRGPFRGTGIAEARKELREIIDASMLTSDNYEGVLSYEHAVLGALLGALDKVGGMYGDMKEGRMDFDDILIETYGLLSERPKVAEEEGKRIRFLFVDEFQDVDPLQYRMIELLQNGNRDMQVSVFGDPKQSIYSFRGADVEVFNRVANEYGQKPLDRNYRSTPALVSFFNCVTKGVFSEHAEGYLTPYQRLVADRAEFPSEICFDIATKDEDDREAEMIAQRIDSMTGELDVCTKDGATRKAGYGDMAILVDDTTRLSELTRALTRRGIPYQISSGSGFFEAPEVKTLVNLLSVLEDHEDDIALFGLLRSEMFHASDSEIYEISLREGKSLYSKLPPRIREEIEAWSSLVDILPLSELVSLIIREKSYRGILAMGQRRKTSVRNVNRFIGLLRSFESSGVRSIRTMSDMLVRFADMKAREPESGVPEDNCVSIMTIHKAKGLEWPIVIVPYIYKRYRDNSDDLLMGEKEIGIKTNLEQYSIERRKSLTYIRLKKEEIKRYEEERKRVLYVAMTRARDHLFFTGCLNTEQPHRGRCWAREIFDMSLNLTQTVIWCGADNGARLHFAVEFDQKGGMRLKKKSVAQNRAARETEQVSEEVRFVDYAPPEQKIMIDPSYAGFLLECPMKYHLARDLGLSEDQLSGVVPAISREADGRFYGSVIHRALELSFAHPRLIVEQVALDESVDIDEGIIREGVRRIERARSVFERSELKEMMPGAMEEVSFLKDMGDFCIKGRADLFLPEKRMVIDYKTDADLSERMREYEVQLTLYAVCLESTEACIYSVRDGALIPVRMDRNKLIADLRGRVRDLRDRKRIRGDHCEKCVYREICGSEGVLKK